MAPAAPTLSEATLPNIGIFTRRSQPRSTSGRMPLPSAPSTTAMGTVKSISQGAFEPPAGAAPAHPPVRPLTPLGRAGGVDAGRDLRVLGATRRRLDHRRCHADR